MALALALEALPMMRHVAILYRSGRFNGKPRQAFDAFLGGADESALAKRTSSEKRCGLPLWRRSVA
jgi:hypothetical protein